MRNKKETLLVFCDFETTGTNPEKHLPVEVALVITDLSLATLSVYSSLINPFSTQKTEWNQEEYRAFLIHRIPFKLIKKKGKSPDQVVSEITELLNKLKTERNAKKVILVSDNAVFEHGFMRKLFSLAGRKDEWPFHYAVWDINLLVLLFPEMVKPEPAHRALGDALLAKETLLRALSKVRNPRRMQVAR